MEACEQAGLVSGGYLSGAQCQQVSVGPTPRLNPREYAETQYMAIRDRHADSIVCAVADARDLGYWEGREDAQQQFQERDAAIRDLAERNADLTQRFNNQRETIGEMQKTISGQDMSIAQLRAMNESQAQMIKARDNVISGLQRAIRNVENTPASCKAVRARAVYFDR